MKTKSLVTLGVVLFLSACGNNAPIATSPDSPGTATPTPTATPSVSPTPGSPSRFTCNPPQGVGAPSLLLVVSADQNSATLRSTNYQRSGSSGDFAVYRAAGNQQFSLELTAFESGHGRLKEGDPNSSGMTYVCDRMMLSE